MSLSVCLITRDAEEWLRRALGSVAGLGAQVLVGDTGSKDNTVSIARELGAQVVTVDWQEDFAAAQNAVLAQATGDWILWINPDEELLPGGVDRLPAILDRPDVLSYAVSVQEIMSASQPDQVMETVRPRLFRRLADVSFVGRLHPHFVVPLEELANRHDMQLLRAELVVQHHAYLSVLSPSKLRWITGLLELELRDRPGQLHYLIEYGRNLLRLNDPRGHEVLAQAADIVLAAADAPASPSPTVASLLEYVITASAPQMRSRLTPDHAAQLVQRWFPNSAPLLWHLAQRAFRINRFRDAAAFLEKVIELGQLGTYDRTMAFDPSIMAEPAIHNLALCRIRLGQLDEAAARFAQLLSNPDYAVHARQGMARVQDLRFRQAGR